MVGILVSFWDGPFSGAMLVLGRVADLNPSTFTGRGRGRRGPTLPTWDFGRRKNPGYRVRLAISGYSINLVT